MWVSDVTLQLGRAFRAEVLQQFGAFSTKGTWLVLLPAGSCRAHFGQQISGIVVLHIK